MYLTGVPMDDDHLASRQLVLDFEETKPEVSYRESRPTPHLALVVDNSICAPSSPTFKLEPNSVEVTNIIRTLGRSLSW